MDSQTAEILQSISQMTQSKGWGYLQREFLFHIEQLQEQINEIGGNEMKYSEGDILKIKLKVMKEIIEYPDRFISMVQTQKIEDFDPYK